MLALRLGARQHLPVAHPHPAEGPQLHAMSDRPCIALATGYSDRLLPCIALARCALLQVQDVRRFACTAGTGRGSRDACQNGTVQRSWL